MAKDSKNTERLSTLGKVLEEIHSRSKDIKENTERRSLMALLVLSFMDANEDIKNGGEFDEFSDLAILNLITRGAEEGYKNSEIHDFIKSLKKELS